jgi:hypothetical protein
MDAFENLSVAIFDTHRAYVMYANIVVAILSILLLIVAMSGNSEDSDEIEAAAWAIGYDGNDNKIGYYGTKAFSGSGFVVTYESCASSNSVCEDCETGGNNGLNSTVCAFIFICVMMVLSVLRRGDGDMLYYKAGAVGCGFLALLCMIIGMGSWNDSCVENLPTNNGASYGMGPGLNCVLVTFLITLFPFLTHLLVATKNSDATPAPVETAVVAGTV